MFSVIFERLSDRGQVFEAQTKEHIERYSKVGLRTMAVAYRELADDGYTAWEQEFMKAKISVSADRDDLVADLADKIERDLILLGATAVEDKLQKGVSYSNSECVATVIYIVPSETFETIDLYHTSLTYLPSF